MTSYLVDYIEESSPRGATQEKEGCAPPVRNTSVVGAEQQYAAAAGAAGSCSLYYWRGRYTNVLVVNTDTRTHRVVRGAYILFTAA